MKDYYFGELTQEEYINFVSKHEQYSFLQSVEVGNLKKELGDTPHYVGVKNKNKVIAAALILEENSILGFKTFYSPRGFIIDYEDEELLKFFIKNIIHYVKSKKGFRIIIDPNVTYCLRDDKGKIISDKKDNVIKNLKDLKWKHFGFNLYLETLQVRWTYKLDLNKSYDELYNDFSKSTKKNIENCHNKGVIVKVGNIKDLKSLTSIFEKTAERRNFQSRNLVYYEKMYKHMKNLMTLYIAHLDPDIYLKNINNMIVNEKKNLKEIKRKFKTEKVGKKLQQSKQISNNLIAKYKEELICAENFKVNYPQGRDIGALLSIKSNDEYLTLTSGVLSEYKNFTPKYILYEQHIKDALKYKFNKVDFYGITGDFNKENPFYGIYEFKRGFGGTVHELIGQFELKIHPIYYLYNIGRKIKKIIKK